MSKIPAIKEELSTVTQAIILSILIDSIMMNYKHDKRGEATEAINKIKNRVKKYITKKIKTNKIDFASALRISSEIWGSTIDHFEDQNIAIEGVSTVTRIYSLYSEILSKNVNLTESLIEKFSLGVTHFNTLEIEANSYEFADMILDKLSEYTAVKRVRLNHLNKGNKNA
jgi:hypothetical protein